MGLRVSTNILSLRAAHSLSRITQSLARSLERLSSGRRIHSARDDAAGLSIATSLEAQSRGLQQTIRNVNDAVGFLQTADSVLQIQSDIVQRMKELALESSNGTLGNNDRGHLNNEFAQLLEEFNRLTSTTSFGDTKLLDGSLSNLTIQVGTQKNQTLSISTVNMTENKVFTQQAYQSTGSYTSSSQTLGSSYSLDLGDLDEDGDIDAVASGYASDQIWLYFNDGSGAFSNPVTYTAGDNPTDVNIVDLNNDGYMDIAEADWSGATIAIRLGNGNGTFETIRTYSSGTSPSA